MIIDLLLAFGSVAWIAGLSYFLWAGRKIPELDRLTLPDPPLWPTLSVIVPACNEADHLEAAVTTLLAQDYPELEIILVNDRSTDETGAIIERLAAKDSRVRPLHIDRLPEGWLGKVHALQRGLELARGAWLLFTDADVHFAPAALRAALALALHRQVDHLALLPRAVHQSLLLSAAVQAFGLLFLIGTRAGSINRVESSAFVGVGAFSLVRAEALRRTPGFEWLRMEPCDDVGLGLMLKQSGARSFLAVAHQHLTVEWYPNLTAMFRGLEKNLFGAFTDYRWMLSALESGLLVALSLTPILALHWCSWTTSAWLCWLAVCVFALHGLATIALVSRDWRAGMGMGLLPVGLILIAAMLFNGGWQCWLRQGIDWRGSHYPIGSLRAGQRVGFMTMARSYLRRSA